MEDGDLYLKTDMWGVGCIMHEMVTGERPWFQHRHSSQHQIWQNHVSIENRQIASRAHSVAIPLAKRLTVHYLSDGTYTKKVPCLCTHYTVDISEISSHSLKKKRVIGRFPQPRWQMMVDESTQAFKRRKLI